MNLRKSFVYTASLPSAGSDMSVFEQGLGILKEKKISVIEFYADFDAAEKAGTLLRSYGMDGVYLAAAYQKKNNFSLCAADDNERQKALNETYRCFEAASRAKVKNVLITSGHYWGAQDEDMAWECLADSIKKLGERYPEIQITLEPGDRDIDFCQLAGPTLKTVEWAERLHSEIPNFSLTMDTSHIAQLNENAYSSLKAAERVCNHIHLANCVLKPGHPLFGDKHPAFDYPDSVFSTAEITEIAKKIKATGRENIILSVEIINRLEDEMQGFRTIIEDLDWFFEM